MDFLDFAKYVKESSDDFQIEEWASRVTEVIAERTFYLAQYSEAIPDDVKEAYSSFVLDMLSKLPEGTVIEVTPYLYSRLQKLLPIDQEPALSRVLNAS
jgi:hypothetical protein